MHSCLSLNLPNFTRSCVLQSLTCFQSQVCLKNEKQLRTTTYVFSRVDSLRLSLTFAFVWLLVASYKIFLISENFIGLQKFKNQNVFQDILSNLVCWTPPPQAHKPKTSRFSQNYSYQEFVTHKLWRFQDIQRCISQWVLAFDNWFLVHFYTYYDHKNGSSSLNNGVKHLILNQSLDYLRQCGHFLSNFTFVNNFQLSSSKVRVIIKSQN